MRSCNCESIAKLINRRLQWELFRMDLISFIWGKLRAKLRRTFRGAFFGTTSESEDRHIVPVEHKLQRVKQQVAILSCFNWNSYPLGFWVSWWSMEVDRPKQPDEKDMKTLVLGSPFVGITSFEVLMSKAGSHADDWRARRECYCFQPLS